jgi:hypothetical protein
MINIIGDSHSLCFSGTDWIKVYWLGARTAFNLWKANKDIVDILNRIPPDEDIYFCFGEIDARIHIYKSCMNSKVMPLSFFVDITAFNYAKYIHTLTYKERKVGIMAVPPQGTQDNFFGYEHYASRDLRQTFTHGINAYLEGYCLEYKMKYLDIWDWDDEYLWSEEDFKDDQCHIKNEIAIPLLEMKLCMT